MPIREQFKEKIISYIANQYQEPEKNWIFMEFDGHQYLARIYSAENGYIGAAFSLERIVSGFVGERKDLCVEVRDNETGEVKIHQGTRKSGISTTCVYPLKYTNAQIYVSMDEGMLDPGGTFGTLLLMGVMMLGQLPAFCGNWSAGKNSLCAIRTASKSHGAVQYRGFGRTSAGAGKCISDRTALSDL